MVEMAAEFVDKIYCRFIFARRVGAYLKIRYHAATIRQKVS